MSDKEDSGGFTIQVIAGALAAITAALLGSTLGMAGTVLGAGVASVVTTVGAALYLRSLRGVHARVVTRTEPPPATRRRLGWPALAAATVLAFVLGMLVITGVEWARGAQLSGGQGTTIGGIVRPGSGPVEHPRQGGVTVPIEPTGSPTVTSTQPPTTSPGQTSTTPPVTSTEAPSTTPPSTTTTGPATTREPSPSGVQ